jgi:hypothetical protein
MLWRYNKEGPDFDVGFLQVKSARDETVRSSRDGPGGLPRDGTLRKPRSEIIPARGSPEISHYFRLITGPPTNPGNSYKPLFKWRKTDWGEPALLTGRGRGMHIRIMNYEL